MKPTKTDQTSEALEYKSAKPATEENPALSDELLKLFSDSAYLGNIHPSDGYAYQQGDCGDSMEVFLMIKANYIQKARFDTLGCGFTVACGNMTMQMAEGKRIQEAMKITSRQIIKAFDNLLPPSHYHCAEMAEATLKAAIRDYLLHGKDSWKKLYRNR